MWRQSCTREAKSERETGPITHKPEFHTNTEYQNFNYPHRNYFEVRTKIASLVLGVNEKITRQRTQLAPPSFWYNRCNIEGTVFRLLDKSFSLISRNFRSPCWCYSEFHQFRYKLFTSFPAVRWKKVSVKWENMMARKTIGIDRSFFDASWWQKCLPAIIRHSLSVNNRALFELLLIALTVIHTSITRITNYKPIPRNLKRKLDSRLSETMPLP